MLNSDDLRLFLAIMREGNMVAASRRSGVDHSTVARRLSALETTLGSRLFDRSPRGVTPTPAAFALLGHAERIESELLAAAASVSARDSEVDGAVRLATPEIFGTFVVAPRVRQLRVQHPRLTLELAPESRTTSLSKREADIAVMLKMPPKGRLVARKLADYRLGLFASPAYLEQHGEPRNRADLNQHYFVSYIEELAGFPELIALDQILPGANVGFRSSSSAAQHAAVAAGMGLGMLHLIAAREDAHMIRILPDQVEVQRSYWLVMHADQQRMPRVRAVVDFLEESVRRMCDQL